MFVAETKSLIMPSSSSKQNSVPKEERRMEKYSMQVIPLLMNTIGFISTGILFMILESGVFLPHRNGFFCSDRSISYPVEEETLSTGMLILINVLVAITVIVMVEQVVSIEKPSLSMYTKKEPHWLTKLCEANHLLPIRATKVTFVLIWYVFANTILTDVIKLTVGRLRPNFLAVCNPNVTCSTGRNEEEYHLNYVCQNVTTKEENHARLSFPSGHASMSATIMGFIIVYVQTRFKAPDKFVLLKPIIHLSLLVLSVWISMTRVSDYQHHMTDVLFGFCQGTLIGVLGGIQSTKGAEMLLYSQLNMCETQALINKTNADQTSYNSSNLNITATNLQKTFLDDNKIKRDVEEASDDPK